jgi:hypothetical protein
MVEGVKKQAIEMQMIGEEKWKKGIEELHKTARPGSLSVIRASKG